MGKEHFLGAEKLAREGMKIPSTWISAPGSGGDTAGLQVSRRC